MLRIKQNTTEMPTITDILKIRFTLQKYIFWWFMRNAESSNGFAAK
jgi:hypothetical protein